MGDFFDPQRTVEKDYSLRQLWRAMKGLPAAAILGATALSATHIKPDDWEQTILNYDTSHGVQQAKVMLIPAYDEPIGVVGFMPGWKTSVFDKIEAIEDFRHSGFSVASIRLVNPGTQTGTLADSLERINGFAFSEDSPLYTAFPEDLQRFAVTHSTSGMLFQHSLISARFKGEKLPPIEHAFHTAPFFDTSGSSEEFHPVSHWLYKRHARRHFNELAGTPLMDRMYYYLRGISYLLMEEDPSIRPTHGQILEISEFGKNYFARKEEEIIAGMSPITLPQTFVISTDDSFSCPKTATKAAKLEGADIQYCEAQHDVLLASPVRKSIIERMKELTVSPGLTRSTPDKISPIEEHPAAGNHQPDDGELLAFQYV